jgi:hypothetical protein
MEHLEAAGRGEGNLSPFRLQQVVNALITFQNQLPVLVLPDGKILRGEGFEAIPIQSLGGFPLEFYTRPELLQRPRLLAYLLQGLNNSGVTKAELILKLFGDAEPTGLDLDHDSLVRMGYELAMRESWLNAYEKHLRASSGDAGLLMEITTQRGLVRRAHARVSRFGGEGVPPFQDFRPDPPPGGQGQTSPRPPAPPRQGPQLYVPGGRPGPLPEAEAGGSRRP